MLPSCSAEGFHRKAEEHIPAQLQAALELVFCVLDERRSN
jgi:hypothetical protein